jgi:hypothetical protein
MHPPVVKWNIRYPVRTARVRHCGDPESRRRPCAECASLAPIKVVAKIMTLAYNGKYSLGRELLTVGESERVFVFGGRILRVRRPMQGACRHTASFFVDPCHGLLFWL